MVYEDFDEEKKIFDRIKKQGLEYQYKSDNPIASKCIVWLNEWTKEKIQICNDFFNGHIKGLKSIEECKAVIRYWKTNKLTESDKEQIKREFLLKRCMLLESYIEKIESTLNEPCDFEFFNLYEDLYRCMIISLANEDYEQNYKYACMLADYRKIFNEKCQ